MAFVHGKNTVLLVGAVDISVYTNTSEFGRKADKHDVTTYGKNDHVYEGGLGDGSFSMGGIYDNTAVSGPRALLEPLIGTVVVLTRQPEGDGLGLPQDIVNVLVEEYVETSPVADMVTWSCSMQPSDSVNSAVQA